MLNKKVFTRKANVGLMVIESLLFGLFSHATLQYYDLSLDLMNQYPFRESLALFLSIFSMACFSVIAIIWMIFCLREHEGKAFLIMMVIVLFIGLLIMDPVIGVLDTCVTSLFHLIPEDVQNEFVHITQLLKRWLNSFM